MNEKAQAYQAVRRAIESGRLVRPSSCERCGALNAPCSDGRSRIHAHHHDYSRPLDVEWICANCHRKETPLPKTMGAPNFGEKNGCSKLNNADVLSIRRLRSIGATYRAIAERFGVDKATVMRAAKGQRWSHVNEIAAAPKSTP